MTALKRCGETSHRHSSSSWLNEAPSAMSSAPQGPLAEAKAPGDLAQRGTPVVFVDRK